MKRTTRKLYIGSALMVATATTGCHGSFATLEYGPEFELRGNAQGIDAFFQGQMAAIEGAKTADGKATEAGALYREKESTRRLRYVKPRSTQN